MPGIQAMLKDVASAKGLDYDEWLKGLKAKKQWHVEVYWAGRVFREHGSNVLINKFTYLEAQPSVVDYPGLSNDHSGH